MHYYRIDVKRMFKWECEIHGEMTQDQAIAKMWELTKDETVIMVRYGYYLPSLKIRFSEFYADGSYIG